VWNTSLVGELVDATWVSSIAGTTSLAINDNLGIETNWGISVTSLPLLRMLNLSAMADVEP